MPSYVKVLVQGGRECEWEEGGERETKPGKIWHLMYFLWKCEMLHSKDWKREFTETEAPMWPSADKWNNRMWINKIRNIDIIKIKGNSLIK